MLVKIGVMVVKELVLVIVAVVPAVLVIVPVAMVVTVRVMAAAVEAVAWVDALVVRGVEGVTISVKVVPERVRVDAVMAVAPAKEIVYPVVLVPPTQEVLILFFKSLIKRIKIDINMTKLQVLGELL